jgi:hypothetical protein
LTLHKIDTTNEIVCHKHKTSIPATRLFATVSDEVRLIIFVEGIALTLGLVSVTFVTSSKAIIKLLYYDNTN